MALTDYAANEAHNRSLNTSYGILIVVTAVLALFLSSAAEIVILCIGLALPAALLHLFGRMRYDVLVVHLLGIYAFWLIYAVLVGSVGLSQFASPSFYAGEGRIFLGYIFFLALAGLVLNRDALHWADLALRAFAGFAILAALANIAGVLPSSLTYRGGVVLLMSSHHSAGYFFSFLALYFIARLLVAQVPGGLADIVFQRRWDAFFAAGSLLALLSTNSRTALVGVVVALVLYYARYIFRIRVLFPALVATVLAVFVLPPLIEVTNPRMAAKLSAISDERTRLAVSSAVQVVMEADDPIPVHEELVNRHANNVTVRFYLWTIAARKFIDSPIIGLGAMRWNDQIYAIDYTEINGGFRILTETEERDSGAGNAHNAYLMLLAETGLVGFTLMLSFWLALARRMRIFGDAGLAHGDEAFAAVAVTGRLSVFFVLGSALTSFAFAAPSLVIFPMVMCGLAMATVRSVGGGYRVAPA